MAGSSKKNKDPNNPGEEGPHAGTSLGPQNLTLNTNKAGMEGLDTEKINEIIKNASEGSRFYQHKQKRQQELDIKLDQMKEAAKNFTDKQIKEATKQMDELVRELEAGRDLSHTIVHVDMDMFYAAVEMRDDPTLRDKPMAVGGMGMLSTSNYAARRFGVRAAMPGFIGKKLCPDLILVPQHFDKYKKVSRQVQEVMAEYDPSFCAMSLDEAYLDITQYLLNSNQDHDEDVDMGNRAQTVVAEMREKIHAKTQLTASAGIAPNTRLAKVCSDMNKPNGQYYLQPDLESIKKFVSTLSIRKVSGIGNVTEQHLHALGITQCSHLMEKRGLLRLLFSDTSYQSFMSIALGLGHTTLCSWNERSRKSISNETTFKGTSDRAALIKITESLCQDLAEEMEQKDIVGKVITLKLKTVNFEIRSRAQTLSAPTSSFEALFSTARRILLHEMNNNEGPLSLRLIGVRMSSLMNSTEAGSSRQVTLTQMFSKATKANLNTSDPEEGSLLVDTEDEDDVKCLDKSKENVPCAEKPLEKEKLKLPSELSGHSKTGMKVEAGTDKKDKVVSVKAFLLNNKESLDARKMEEYECSVCGEQVQVRNLNEFNRHLDFCLEKHASCNPKIKLSSCEDDDSSLSVSQNKRSPANCKSQTDHTQMKNTNREQSAVGDKSDVMEGNTEMNNCTVPENLYLCPVCHKQQLSDVESLTKHVDDCLSKSAISEMLKGKVELQGESSRGTFGSSQKPAKEPAKGASHPVPQGKRKGSSSGKNSKKVKGNCNTLDRYFT